MGYFNLPFGVRISNNSVLDGDRYVVTDASARDNLIINERAYEGLLCYVSNEKQLYILKDLGLGTWEKIGIEIDDGIYVKEASLGNDFIWEGGYLDVSIVTMDYDYVDGSLAIRDSRLDIHDGSIGDLYLITDEHDTSINDLYLITDELDASFNQLKIVDLADVSAGIPEDKQIIIYDSSLGKFKLIDTADAAEAYAKIAYVDGSLALRDASLEVLFEWAINHDASIGDLYSITDEHDASIVWLFENFEEAGVSQEYVDGSLATRDLRLDIHDGSIGDLYSITDEHDASIEVVFGWGDHSAEGYITSESDPVFTSWRDENVIANKFLAGPSTGSASPATFREIEINDVEHIAQDSSLINLDDYLKEIDISRNEWDEAYGWGDHSEIGYATITYVDGSLAVRDTRLDIHDASIGDLYSITDEHDASIIDLYNITNEHDASIVWLFENFEEAGVSQEYVDGSLAIRDTRLNIHDASIGDLYSITNELDASINDLHSIIDELDASIDELDLIINELDASIEVAFGWGDHSQAGYATITYVDGSLADRDTRLDEHDSSIDDLYLKPGKYVGTFDGTIDNSLHILSSTHELGEGPFNISVYENNQLVYPSIIVEDNGNVIILWDSGTMDASCKFIITG